jgi:hypothetical protein
VLIATDYPFLLRRRRRRVVAEHLRNRRKLSTLSSAARLVTHTG